MQRTSAVGGITVVTFADGRIAEIVLGLSASSKHVIDAMDLARLLLVHGITVAKIIKPATGEPAINIAHNVKGVCQWQNQN